MATKVSKETKVPMAKKVPMATKVLMATKHQIATKSTNRTKFNPRGLASYVIWACFLLNIDCICAAIFKSFTMPCHIPIQFVNKCTK